MCQSHGWSGMANAWSMNVCAIRGGRTQAVRQSSRGRWLDGACSVGRFCHPGPYRKRCLPSPRCAPFGSNSLSQESKVDGGVQNRRCPLLSSSTPLTTSMLAMGRRGRRCGWGTKCISLRPASDLAPQLITHVETTPAPISDEGVLSTLHDDLAEKELLPDHHLVDAGYVTSANLVKTQADYGVDLVGPTLKTRLLSSGDRLRPHTLLHRLGSRDGHLPTRSDQFELDSRPRFRQIAHQGEVFSKRL